jgi:quercetin dioxygenase-like cupin family protein
MKIHRWPVLTLLLSGIAVAQVAALVASDAAVNRRTVTQDSAKPQRAVPITREPHHKLVLENDYVRVFNVVVPPHEATLMHQHDVPYLYVTLGPTDLINAIAGKPEMHLVTEDGTTRYTPGPFAHLVRTDAGILFHNITVELLKPQAEQVNLGAGGKDRPLGSCPQSAGGFSRQTLPCFETSELRLERVAIEGEKGYVQASPEDAALLVAMTDANLDVSISGKHAAVLHTGDVLWLPAGSARKLVDAHGGKSEFLLISFKDSNATAAK